jgi:hypothetical protein
VLAFVNETTTFSCPSKPDLVILVVTSIPNVDHRLSIRETWASIKQLNNLEILTLFVMGRIADEKGPFKVNHTGERRGVSKGVEDGRRPPTNGPPMAVRLFQG